MHICVKIFFVVLFSVSLIIAGLAFGPVSSLRLSPGTITHFAQLPTRMQSWYMTEETRAAVEKRRGAAAAAAQRKKEQEEAGIFERELEVDDKATADSADDGASDAATSGNAKFVTVNGFKMFVKRVVCPAKGGDSDARAPVVLFHGFPSSSFEFHRVAGPLSCEVGPVVLFDHVGFGFSDKPHNSDARVSRNVTTNAFFSYSVIDHAENAIALLGPRHLNLTEAHLVSHDMGSTILPEILGRIHRGSLLTPAGFPTVLSVTFTNGGMIYKLSQPRITQVLLATPGVGTVVQRLIARLDQSNALLARQLATVWPPQRDFGATAQMRQDIDDIITLLRWQGGHMLLADLITYINDRKTSEWRWHGMYADLAAIAGGRCAIVWGDADAVAPLDIARAVHDMTQRRCTFRQLKGVGHFSQLEAPAQWVDAVKANALRVVKQQQQQQQGEGAGASWTTAKKDQQQQQQEKAAAQDSDKR